MPRGSDALLLHRHDQVDQALRELSERTFRPQRGLVVHILAPPHQAAVAR